MIQRIQTIYLLMVIFFSGACPFFLPIWANEAGVDVFAIDEPLILGLSMGSALLAFIVIFLFNNRKTQLLLGRLDIILNFVILGFFVYWTLSVPGEMQISEKGIGMLIPILSIVFLVLANKAIQKDEALVKSVDRLR